MALVVFGLYLVPVLIQFWHILPHLATSEPEYGAGDLAKYNWSVAWVVYALSHGQGLFVSHVANVPFGVNLLDDTSILGLGVVMSPVTALFGPFATVNLLLIAAFPLSASCGYLLARRYVGWRPAAFAAGLLYGYSPYMVSQGYSHLNLSFAPLPPLILLVLDEMVVRQRRSPVRLGLLLGALVAAQFFISTEILATTALFAAVAVITVCLFCRDQVRSHLRFALRSLAVAAVTSVALLAYPAYTAVLGPDHIHGAIGGFRIYVSALLGPVLPTSVLLFGTHHLKALGDQIGGNASENGSYLGVPLVVLLIAAPLAVRKRTVVVPAVLALVAFVLSLGVRLHVGLPSLASSTRLVILPAAVLYKIPLIGDSFPVRYSLYVALFASLVLAAALQALRRRAGIGAAALLAVIALLPLVPAWPAPAQGHVGMPAYFTSGAVKELPAGQTVLVYPMAAPTNAAAMDWQAVSKMRFSMPGGYFVVPKQPSGSQFFTPTLTARTLGGLAAGRPVARTPAERSRLAGELRAWHVRSVLVQPVGADPVGFFTWLIGRPPDATSAGLSRWYDVRW